LPNPPVHSLDLAIQAEQNGQVI